MGHASPVTRLSLAFGAGVAWALVGAPLWLAPLVSLLLIFLPIGASRGPLGPRVLWLLTGLAGLVSAVDVASATSRCPPAHPTAAAVLEGRFLASPRAGSAPFVSDSGCGPFTVVVAIPDMAAGAPVRLEGAWRQGRSRPWFLAQDVSRIDRPGDEWRWRAVRWRDALVGRLDRLYGPRAPLVAALTLARREGLDPALRETFARVGIAHLLAISGFHVGVVAGAIFVLLFQVGLGTRRAGLGAAIFAWLYVAFIGFPDAACRAALILTAAALARARGRPAARWAALSTALLVLLVLEPHRLASPGFQLSFAGAAGLTAWSGSFARAIRRLAGPWCPLGVAISVAAGLAATLATVPIVAWHFGRVSLVGVPATLAATPLVTVGLIGALGSLILDFLSPSFASVLAGGVSVVIALLEWLATAAGGLPWASAWVTRPTVVGGVVGVIVAAVLARRPRVGATARRSMTLLYAGMGVLAWPLLLTYQGRGTAEILMIDVGQGDAIALRSPRGRWLLIDAGPPATEGDPAAHPVVRMLRSRGVRRLNALVLTHPDLDHIGGAAAVLASFDVATVYDPGLPAGKQAFVDVLDAAASRSVPWRAARAGDRLELDGLTLDILYPTGELGPDDASNASSVVIHAAFGDFDVLLTGDAYKDVDRLLAPNLTNEFEVLKVGHHGSDTSTDSLLLADIRPELALISVGRSNRYGHPATDVLTRLDGVGAHVHRTDQEGTISVLGRANGSYSVSSRR
ncbi:MAG: DNA internalization-related competence protein ComEC/Rec2 [Gemmatimonadota bacterium]|nr:DNA internalization-related competence protein ComEC/Rec2 [Gemmatimonadota bacterium]